MLSLDDRIHFGAEATRMIAILGREQPSLLRRWVLAGLGTAPWARALYPWLNRTRQLLLRILGRKLIA